MALQVSFLSHFLRLSTMADAPYTGGTNWLHDNFNNLTIANALAKIETREYAQALNADPVTTRQYIDLLRSAHNLPSRINVKVHEPVPHGASLEYDEWGGLITPATYPYSGFAAYEPHPSRNTPGSANYEHSTASLKTASDSAAKTKDNSWGGYEATPATNLYSRLPPTAPVYSTSYITPGSAAEIKFAKWGGLITTPAADPSPRPPTAPVHPTTGDSTAHASKSYPSREAVSKELRSRLKESGLVAEFASKFSKGIYLFKITVK